MSSLQLPSLRRTAKSEDSRTERCNFFALLGANVNSQDLIGSDHDEGCHELSTEPRKPRHGLYLDRHMFLSLEETMFSEPSPGKNKPGEVPPRRFFPHRFRQELPLWSQVVQKKGFSKPGAVRINEQGNSWYRGAWMNCVYHGHGLLWKMHGQHVFMGKFSKGKPHGTGEWLCRPPPGNHKADKAVDSAYGLHKEARSTSGVAIRRGLDGRGRTTQNFVSDKDLEKDDSRDDEEVLELLLESSSKENLIRNVKKRLGSSLSNFLELDIEGMSLGDMGEDEEELRTALAKLQEAGRFLTDKALRERASRLPKAVGFDRFVDLHLLSKPSEKLLNAEPDVPLEPQKRIFVADCETEKRGRMPVDIESIEQERQRRAEAVRLAPQTEHYLWHRGEWLMGIVHGHGERRFCNGSWYVGGFKNGRRHGFGVEKWIVDPCSLSFCYDGLYKRDRRHGRGKLFFADGTKYVGEFRSGWYHGQGREERADGSAYEGQWKQGLFHGRGKLEMCNGSSIEGEFRRGKVHGKATLIDRGEVKTGEWCKGKLVGKSLTAKQQTVISSTPSFRSTARKKKEGGTNVSKSKRKGTAKNSVRSRSSSKAKAKKS